MIFNTSLVAVWYSSDSCRSRVRSRVSLRSRAFSIAMTACTREIQQQCDLLIGEGTDLLAPHRNCATENVVLAQRHGDSAPHTARFYQGAKSRRNTESLVARCIREPNNLFTAHNPPGRRGIIGRCEGP